MLDLAHQAIHFYFNAIPCNEQDTLICRLMCCSLYMDKTKFAPGTNYLIVLGSSKFEKEVNCRILHGGNLKDTVLTSTIYITLTKR